MGNASTPVRMRLSPQMFAVLDAIVTGVGYGELEPFPPRHTIAALVRRGLLEERAIKRNPQAPTMDEFMASLGCAHILPTDAGRKVVADAEAALANPIPSTEPPEADHA